MLRYIRISLFITFLDQLSKLYIQSSYSLYESRQILGSFLKFTYIENPGIVFGIRVGSLFYYLITILSLCIVAYIYLLIKTSIDDSAKYDLSLVALSLILGGAIGNIIDRLFVIFSLFNYSGVVDFIDIGVQNMRFYIFNIADTFVTIGLILFMYYNYSEKQIVFMLSEHRT